MAGCISKPYREHSNGLLPLLGLLLVAGAMSSAADPKSDSAAAARVTAVRFWSLGDTTRIAIEVSSEFHFKSERLSNPDRLYFDVLGAKPELEHRTVQIIHVDDKIIKQIRVAETQPGVTRVVVDLQQAVTMTTSQLSNPARLIIEVKAAGPKSTEGTSTELKPIFGGASVTSAASESAPNDKAAGSNPMARIVRAGRDVSNATAKNITPKAAASKPVDVAPPLVATARVSDALKPVDSRKLSDAKPVQIASIGTSHASPVNVLENPVPIPVSNDSSNLAASLPPEPLGVEPPSAPLPSPAPLSPQDVQREKRDDVKEVLPAKRGMSDDRTLTRALGLKLGRVVIDPGHGGHDVGTHGPSGYLEKDLVLDVSRRLAALIQERMGSEVILTRSDDTYVGLEERTRIANERKADLFLSIHANSSPYRSAAGVETYVLSFTTSKTAMELASRENAGSDLGIHDLQDVLQKIALRDKIDESREFATRLQTSLSALSTRSNDVAKNRGVKKAPFVVLIGANMPSVLAEIGFLTNASDEALLRRPEHRQKIAEALYKGIASYAGTLSQVIARQN